MNVSPILVTREGVLIPREYLPGVEEIETVITDEYILVRSKVSREQALLPSESSRFSFVGIAESGNPNASVEVEEILAKEIDRRSGWTLKPPLDEE